MNYYSWFPSDYWTATHTLTWLEDCAYRRMLDLYYRTEKPLPAHREALYREIRAITKEEKRAVDYVLERYWSKAVGRGTGYVNKKANKELIKARERRHLAVLAGKQSALARNARSTEKEQTLNYSLPLPLPKPIEASRNVSSSQDTSIKPLQRESQTLSPALLKLAMDAGMNNAPEEFKTMLDYSARNGEPIYDLHAAWRVWIKRYVEYKKSNGSDQEEHDDERIKRIREELQQSRSHQKPTH